MATARPLRYRAPYVRGVVADWVSEIPFGRSGVYVIRSRRSKRVLYVGESHTGRLRKTMLRHFQFWQGFTAGKVYGKASVDVAFRLTAPGRAVAEQDRLICRLNARDNEVRSACPAGDPF